MAIGKGDLADSEQRTALHYAVAYDRAPAVKVGALRGSARRRDAADLQPRRQSVPSGPPPPPAPATR